MIKIVESDKSDLNFGNRAEIETGNTVSGFFADNDPFTVGRPSYFLSLPGR